MSCSVSSPDKFQLDGVKSENKTDQLSETSNGQEILGAEEEPGTSVGAEEDERVTAGPGRPKKMKVDPSHQLQVLRCCVHCS